MRGTVSVLGWIRYVTDEGEVVDLRSSGQRRLLAALACAGGGTIRSELLCEMLGLAPSALRTSMSRLRARVGEDVIETGGSAYRLTAAVNAAHFIELASTPGGVTERRANLQAALSLWDDEAYTEFSHEPWAQAEAVRLNELRLVAIEDEAELQVAMRRGGAAVAALEAHINQHPLRDRPRGLHIQALAVAGRQSSALQAFQDYRTFLAEETGTEPSETVKQIERRVVIGSADEALEALKTAFASGLVLEHPPEPEPAAAASDSRPAPAPLPSGIVTFLFTDIEGSTARWEQTPDRMRRALAQHDRILHTTVVDHDGAVFKHTGDGIGAVYTSPSGAVEAAIDIQRRLQAAEWEDDDRLKVRIGMYVGEATPTNNDYYGAPVSRAAKVMDVANGDQIAIPSALASFLMGFDVTPVGNHQLRGVGTEAISLVTADDLLIDGRPLRSRVAGDQGLPVQHHRLIGRDAEVKELRDLIGQHRCVTLVGPGGVGKTRLSLAVGEGSLAFFTDGVIFCELANISDGDAVVDEVAQALGARSQPGMDLTESIVNFLEERRVLLIFDNCEHVADAVRELGRQILTLTSSSILATSRESLGLPAERLYGVNPLETENDAVELFVERATERDHQFAPDAADLEHIRHVCERLDGIPLGIELAAAWVRVLSPEQLVDQLQDRFRVLRGTRGVGRHETLRDTVRWSYERLDDDQARLFDRLSVFSGGFSLDAAEAVCTDDDRIRPRDVLDLLMSLVDKSMVSSVRGVGHIRFTLLGTLRQFGQEQLDARDDSEQFRRRHADYFGELAATGAALLISDQESEVWQLLHREWANLRAGFETFLALGETEAAGSMVLELGWYAFMSMRFELFAWVDEVVEAIELDTHPLATDLYGLQAMSAYFTVNAACVELAQRGLDIDPTDQHGYCRLALTAVAMNNELAAEMSATASEDWLTHLSDASPTASKMMAEGMRSFHLCVNDPSPAAAVHAANLAAIAEQTSSASATALSHWAGGILDTFHGIEAAMDRWTRGIDAVQSLSPVHVIHDMLVGLVLHFTVARGDLDEAITGCLDAVEQAHENHYNAGTSHLFGVTAIVLCRVDRSETAAALLGSMIANGHTPRSNARRAVDNALGDRVAECQQAGSGLSTSRAATMALDALREISQERVPSL